MLDVYYWLWKSGNVFIVTTSKKYYEDEGLSDGYDEADEIICDAMYECGYTEDSECTYGTDLTHIKDFNHKKFVSALAEKGINMIYQGVLEE